MRVSTMVMSALALFASAASATPTPDDTGLAPRYNPWHPPPHSTAPQPGTYVISSMASGQKLAITYNSQGTPLTVTPASSINSQMWLIVDETGGQSIKPLDAIGLEAVWGENGVLLHPSANSVWTIKGTANGYTIQDTKGTSSWGLKSVTDEAWVSVMASTGDTRQKWHFEKVR